MSKHKTLTLDDYVLLLSAYLCQVYVDTVAQQQCMVLISLCLMRNQITSISHITVVLNVRSTYGWL